MNRHWPTITGWFLVAMTLAVVLAEAFAGGFRLWISVFAAAAAASQLCVQRHTQHGLMAALAMMLVLALGFTLDGQPLTKFHTLGIVFALLVGSRGCVRWLLRTRPPPIGVTLLVLSSFAFGLTAIPLQWPAAGIEFRNLFWCVPVMAGVGALLGGLAQVAATPWLTKTIPSVNEDERQPVALWFTLTGWLVLQAGR